MGYDVGSWLAESTALVAAMADAVSFPSRTPVEVLRDMHQRAGRYATLRKKPSKRTGPAASFGAVKRRSPITIHAMAHHFCVVTK